MTQTISTHSAPDKGKAKTFLLQWSIVFFVLLTFPLGSHYYHSFPIIHFTDIHFQDLFQITNYVPFLGYASSWGIHSFTGWLWAFLAAFLAALLWLSVDKRFTLHFDDWYYSIRVLLRYRLAIALFGYGIILLFSLQAPYPSLSDLHTKYGYFLPWKIYYHSLAVSSASYQSTLGSIEIFAGILLLFRRTTVIGASIAAFLLINVVLVNFAYELGDHVVSVYLFIISVFLIGYDAPRLYRLLVIEKTALADSFHPSHNVTFNRLRIVLKSLFVLLIVFYGFMVFKSSRTDRWPYPTDLGIPNAEGFYDVSRFNYNGTDHPYSLTDSLRWENVVFEKWNTLSIEINHVVPINLDNPKIQYQRSPFRRTYENIGNGERLFYSYTYGKGHLYLVNKNDAKDTYRFVLKKLSPDHLLLDGLDHIGNKIHIDLNRVKKSYLLYLGRRHPVKIY